MVLYTKGFVIVEGKRHFYRSHKSGAITTFVECEPANIAQDFLTEDVPELLHDLPDLILAEQKYRML